MIHSQPVVDISMEPSVDTAYVLCGGQSRRMGEDKLFLSVGSQTLLVRTIETCHSRLSHVKLVAPVASKFAEMNYDVVTDDPGCEGPLAGIIAAVRDCKSTHCFITAADFPSLTLELIDSLLAKLSNQQYLGIRETSGLQPLCGIYAKSILPTLIDAADAGERKVISVVQQCNYELVDIDDANWLNVNDQEDLKRARDQYA